MKKNELFKVLGIIMGIVMLVWFFHSRIHENKHSRPYAPPGWDLVELKDIQSITLSPLLSLSVQGLTIDSKVEISDTLLIKDILNEMQGEKEWSNYMTGHWFADELFKITFYLSSGRRMVFKITFHAGKDLAEYYRESDPDSYVEDPGGSKYGSPELYEILSEVINKSGAQWITANSDCWNTDGPLTYVGCSD